MKLKFSTIYAWGLIILVGLWIFLPVLTGPVCLLFLILVIFGAIRKELQFKFNLSLAFFVAFLVFYAAYAFNTKYEAEAMFSLERKLSFLIFPLVFSFVPKFKISRRFLENGFLACLFVLIGLCYLVSFFNFEEHNFDTTYLYSSQFSGLFHHPTYVAMYCSVGIYLLFNRFKSEASKRERFIASAGILFLLYTHIHLDSLSGYLFVFLLMTTLSVKWVFNKWGVRALVGLGLMGCMGIFILLYLVPSLKANLSNSVVFVKSYAQDPQAHIRKPRVEISGNDARLILWTASAEIIKEHPNGIGLGNMDPMMYQKILSYGQPLVAKKHWNPHNQFFQIGIETGVLGLLFFLGILVYLLRFSWKHRDGLLAVVVLSFAFNSLFESMMERQSGIVFFTLWACLLLGLHEVLNAKSLRL